MRRAKLQALADTEPWQWGEDAGDVLLAVLRDRTFAGPDRLLAAALSGNVVVMNEELATELLALVKSDAEPVELRCQAAISLGPILEEMDLAEPDELEDEPITRRTFQRIQQTLQRLHRDETSSSELRRRALEASVRATGEWHADAIRAALASDDEMWRLTAVFCMQYVRGFDREIVEALGSEDPEVRLHAVRAADAWGVKAAWPHVAALLGDDRTSKELLLAAIDACVSINPDEAVDLLGELTGARDEDVADAAHEALDMIAAEQGVGFNDMGDPLP